MPFDFNNPPSRRNTGSLKWDDMHSIFGPVPADAIPLWVADMDFPSPDAVVQAVQQAATRGIYGYPVDGRSCREAAVAWLARRHGWNVEATRLVTVPGVVPGVAMLIRELSAPGDAVAVQTPVYPPLFQCIEAAGRRIARNQLLPPAAGGDGLYRMNLAQLERLFREGVRLFILCSPHNPGGRVWSREELLALGELCCAHDVTVIVDEIHHDLIMPGHRHTVFASLAPEIAQRTVTCVSSSKTFNLGGLPHAQLVMPDDAMRRRMVHAAAGRGLAHGNMFGMIASEAACLHGDQWLDALMGHIAANDALLRETLQRELPLLVTMPLEGTYLPWIDCRALGLDEPELMRKLLARGVVPSNGSFFGPGGEGYLRINLATSRSLLGTALERMVDALR